MHSFIATSTRLSSCWSTLMWVRPERMLIYSREAIALARTRPLDYFVTRT
jgi:hypothetical protein